MSFFEELKRRNVFRVGLAYVVASWLLLQITDVLVSLMGLPEFVGKVVVALVIIGFIPVMAFSWVYEVTPEGIKRESEVDRNESITRETAARLNRTTIVLLVAAIAVVALDRLIPEKGAEPVTPEVSAETTGAEAEPASGSISVTEPDPAKPGDSTPSVAVLPFVNMSADPENEYFSDGISEELLNLLVRIEGLRVPSRTSSFAFKGQNMDIREIADQLEVGHVLEGSVRKAGNRVRITAQLIDVTSDTHLWSDTFDRELEDIFAIQDEIAGQIVEALKLALAPTVSDHKPTENMEAYNLYLQGLYQFRRRGESLEDAERHLRKAVDLDPQFAQAWAVLALTYTVQPNYLEIPTDQVEPLALEAAEQAEALDPMLVEPMLVRGNFAGKRGRLLESIQAFENSARLDPKNSLAQLWLGIGLLEGGYLQLAREHLDLSRNLDPAAGIIADWQARAYYMTGDPETARRHAHQGLALDRRASVVTLLNDYLDRRFYDEMRALVDDYGNDTYWEVWRKIANAREKLESLQSVMAWIESVDADGAYGRNAVELVAHMHLGDVETALSMLPRVATYDATHFTSLWWPNVKHVRQHSAFKVFAREHGLLELWQARGWPDLCRPAGVGDFECD